MVEIVTGVDGDFGKRSPVVPVALRLFVSEGLEDLRKWTGRAR